MEATNVRIRLDPAGPESRFVSTKGAAPDTELTPEALANMSDERFADIFNELQARGDREKLMQRFGQVFQWNKLRAEILK